MSIFDLTALQLGKEIQGGNLTAVDAAEAALEQIRRAEPQIGAFVTVDEEGVLKQARKVQKH